MTFQKIRYSCDGGVGRFTLDVPPLHIIDLDMLAELGTAWEHGVGAGMRVAVFASTGDRAFSAGVAVGDHVAERVPLMLERLHTVIRSMRQSSVVCIAALHGHTLGGGAELALACDILVAAEDTRIGQPEIQLGCYPPVAAVVLPRLIGWARAMELILGGQAIDAETALRFGLVNKVVPRECLEQTVETWVQRLMGFSDPVVRLIKDTMREGLDRTFQAALDLSEKNYTSKLTRIDDMDEGIRAFIEKRPARWNNR